MSRLLKYSWLQTAVLFSNVIGFGPFSAPAGAAGDTVHLTAPHQQTGSAQFLITTLSARNDLLSGDSALIRVGVSSAIPLTQVGVYLNGVIKLPRPSKRRHPAALCCKVSRPACGAATTPCWYATNATKAHRRN